MDGDVMEAIAQDDPSAEGAIDWNDVIRRRPCTQEIQGECRRSDPAPCHGGGSRGC